MTGSVEAHLTARRDAGHKLLVPYVTGGLGDDWVETVEAAITAGADAIEVGIPFSDPVMDGPVIQEASDRALRAGTTPQSVLSALRSRSFGVPLLVMTYYNVAFRAGLERFAASLAEAGVAGVLLPDLPLEEVDPWMQAARGTGVETVLFAAPTAPDERLPRICERAEGFVYAVGLLGVTGVRDQLALSATTIARRVKAVTDKPVLVGVGIGTPEQAVEAAQVADGVIVGSAVVRTMLGDGGPDAVGELVSRFRRALDA